MAQLETRLTLQDKAALITVILLVLTTIAGFVYTLVTGTEQRVLEAIKSVDAKVEKVDKQVYEHVQFHLTNKMQCRETITNAKEENTKKESTSKRVEVAWGGERGTEKREEIRK